MTLCHCGSIYAKSFSFQKFKLLEISCAPSEHGPLESPDPVVMLFHLHCCCILWDAPRKDWEQGAPLVDAWAWFLPVFLWLSFLLSGCRGKIEWLFQEFPEGRKKQAGKVNGSFVFSTFLGAWSWCHLLSCYSLCSRKQELLWIFSVPLAIFLL